MAFVAKGNHRQSGQPQNYHEQLFTTSARRAKRAHAPFARNARVTRSPLDADTCLASGAEQTLAAARLALDERGDPLTKIEVQR
jgi:hypothetical protein